MASLAQKLSDPIRWYFIVLIVALPAGLFFPPQLAFLAENSTFLLSAIFFLGALKITNEDVRRVWDSKITILIFNLLMLIGLPLMVYLIARNIVPEYAVALLILSAMPTGMATPLLADIVGGRASLAMAMTITTSLLAPFTIPLVMYGLAGVSVGIDFWQMFLSIAQIIFIPFALARLIRHYFPYAIERIKGSLSKVSTTFLGLLIAGIVAQQSSFLIESLLSAEIFTSLAVVTILLAFFYLLGYLIYFNKMGEDRITLTVSFANMNFTLAIYLAHTYFPDPAIVVPITLAVIPWFLFIVIFKYMTPYTLLPATKPVVQQS